MRPDPGREVEGGFLEEVMSQLIRLELTTQRAERAFHANGTACTEVQELRDAW